MSKLFNYIELDYPELGICVLKINSPQTLNALSVELIDELDSALLKISNDGVSRVLIITGVGKSFVAGANILQMKNMTKDEAYKFAKKGSDLFIKIENLEIPVIAAINGYALGGGCELALACDLKVASQNSKFGQPEVKLGIIPGFSGNIRLTKQLGPVLAKEFIFTGRFIEANEALRIGLVNKVVENDKVIEEVMSLAREILSNSSNAICIAKKMINIVNCSSERTFTDIEHGYFAECFGHKHQIEGMQAFLEKRGPIFES